MMQKQRASRRSKDRQQAAVFAYCGLCGGEIYLGQLYYEMDARSVCRNMQSRIFSAASAQPCFRSGWHDASGALGAV